MSTLISQTSLVDKPKLNTTKQSITDISSTPFRTIPGLCPFSFRKFQDGQAVRPRVGGINYCTSTGFEQWLDSIGSSLAFTSFRLNQLFLLGLNEAGELSFSHSSFRYCMGLYVDRQQMHFATSNQILSFRGQCADSQQDDFSYDRIYASNGASTVGPLHTHDIGCNSKGEIVFVNTNYNCLSTLSPHKNFKPIWKPSFIPTIEKGDRCHLNGLAMVQGQPRYVTAISHQATEIGGWRDHRESGGCVIDVVSHEIILKGLSMPHSPRWHNGKLWLHNSGTGEFGYIENLETNPTFQPIATCPGFLRGLTFYKDFAIAGTSAPRDSLFTDLTWSQNPFHRKDTPGCGLLVIDLNSGEIVHWLYLGSGQKWGSPSHSTNAANSMATENKVSASTKNKAKLFQLYDVQLIPHVKRPLLVGANDKELAQHISHEPLG